MRNLKKTLALVMALAMVLSFCVVGSAATIKYKDVDNTANYTEAVSILSNLNIIKGYEDGTFRPDNTITRAEAATVLVRTLGMEEVAQGNAGATAFTDVPSDHWASGYINTAYNQGIIDGMGNGIFAPEENVKFEQMVKMLVAALGYTPKATANGGYPTGYLSVASQEGITKGATGTTGKDATRSTVAKLVYNSLEVKLMDVKEFTTGTAGSTYGVSEDTILSKYLEVTKLEAYVSETYLSGSDYKKDDKAITLIATSNQNEKNGVYEYEKNASYQFQEGNTDASALIGYSVIAYVGEDDLTGDETIFAISKRTGTRNTETVVYAEDFENANEDNETKTSTVIFHYLPNSSNKKDSTIEVKDDAAVYVNGQYMGSGVTAKTVDSYMTNGGYATFVKFTGTTADVVLITKYETDGNIVVKAIDYDDYTIDAYEGDDSLIDYDPDDDDEIVVFQKGDVTVTFEDIKEGDVLTVIKSPAVTRVIIAENPSFEGKVTAYDSADNTVTIAGKDYKCADSVTPQAVSGKDGIIYLNAMGQVVYIDGNINSKGTYAYLLGGEADSKFGTTTYTLKFLSVDGTVYEKTLSTNVKLYEGKDTDGSKPALTVFNKLIANDAPTSAAYPVFKYSLTGDKVSSIFLNGYTNFSIEKRFMDTNTRKYDSEMNTYGSAEFDENTMAFSIKGTKDTTDSDDVSVTSLSKLFKDDETYTFAYVITDEDISPLVVAYNVKSTFDSEANVIVVTSTKSIVYGDDDADAVQITALQGGKEITFVAYDEDGVSYTGGNEAALSKGDILQIAEGADGCASDVRFLLNVSGSKNENNVPTTAFLKNDEGGNTVTGKIGVNAYGVATLNGTSSFEIEGISNDTFASVSRRSSYTYTGVSFYDSASSTKNAVIAKRTASSIMKDNKKYAYVVFVHYYEEDVIDVVAYEYNEDNFPNAFADALQAEDVEEVAEIEEIGDVEDVQDINDVDDEIEIL